MNHFREKPKFEIQSTIEQKPFENPAVQSFFTKWCEINDSIQPQIVTREQWDNRGTQGISEKSPSGKQILFIPENLQLWEMIGVMEVIDKETFITEPGKATEAKEKMLALGRTFENTGSYIAKRLNKIEKGKEIADALALEFYQYGQSLTQGKIQEASHINNIASLDLTPQETETVDRFLAGDSLYESRKQRVEKLTTEDKAEKDALYEKEREKTLSQFFRVAEKAFALKNKKTDRKLQENRVKPKPWQSNTPIHSAFLRKIERGLTKQIETPKREFEASIFRRGIELLQRNMPFDRLPDWVKDNCLHWQNGEITLREALKIDELKEELNQIQKINDIEAVVKKEKEIADKIQRAVSSFPYKTNANNPSEIVANQHINCVGASILGGALMKEAGLNYLVGSVPDHSILFLVTGDGRIEWRDMLDPSSNEYLTDEIIKGQRKDGKPLIVSDIVAFSHKPSPEGLMFIIDDPKYRDKLPWIKENQHQHIAVFEPNHGQQIQVLNNIGGTLRSLGRYEEAVEAYRQATDADPKYAYPYNGLGNALYFLGRHEEAIKAYRQAINIDPKYIHPYAGLSNVFRSLGRYKEAVEVCRQAIEIDPKDAHPYISLGNAFCSLGRYEEATEIYRQAIEIDPNNAYSYNSLADILRSLGRHEEAIKTYQKFIDLADKKGDDYWIKRAERIIAGLKK